MPTINVVTLGEPRCLFNGADTALPTQKRRFALLAYLALERSAPRARILALFYPEIDECRASRRLIQSVYAIRQVFGHDCIETRGGELRARDWLICDAGDFGACAERGDYEFALPLYRRPFLDGFYLKNAFDWERWVDRRRAVLARTFAQAVRLWIGRLIEQGEFAAAIAQASRWLELDVDNREAHRVFMTALARAGRGEDALRHYQLWERDLREHDGDRPCDQMRAFVDTLRATVGLARIDQTDLAARDRLSNVVVPNTPTRPGFSLPQESRLDLPLRRAAS